MIDALQKVQDHFDDEMRDEMMRINASDAEFNIDEIYSLRCAENKQTRGGYFRVGNVAIKIAQITELT